MQYHHWKYTHNNMTVNFLQVRNDLELNYGSLDGRKSTDLQIQKGKNLEG
jgi:hypothetical protein